MRVAPSMKTKAEVHLSRSAAEGSKPGIITLREDARRPALNLINRVLYCDRIIWTRNQLRLYVSGHPRVLARRRHRQQYRKFANIGW
jgi:hypothetical protein